MNIFSSIPLNNKNWFQTGGPARFFCEPTSAQEFQEALAFACTHNLDVFILGEGANVLISDDGFDGLVIRPRLKSLNKLSAYNVERLTHLKVPVPSASHIYIHAGAGTSMSDCIEYALRNNACGLEEFSGIPGTVGGSVFINIHYFNFLLSNFIYAGEIIHKKTGEILWVPCEWFNFGYNNSSLHHQEYLLLSAIFKIEECSPLEASFAQGRRHEMIRHRAHRYPTSHTCGSFFRNFFINEITNSIAPVKVPFVAYYLDALGIKGMLKVGGARVSSRHANMIVNEDRATSRDIITLARMMQERVFTTFGLLPAPECRLVGFKEYPLLI